jgi:CTP:molybdopterin cytidylyltransferase MocA
MGEATVIILHPPLVGDGPLTMLLHEARQRLAEYQAALFLTASADRVTIERRPRAATFAVRLAEIGATVRGGVVLLGAGAVPLLRASDARRLVEAARGEGPAALTNNWHSSDVLAVADAGLLLGLVGAHGDNALPRLLTESGITVEELPDRARLAMDLDTPLDLALLALAPGVPGPLRDLAHARRSTVPRLAELRAVAADPGAELLVFGRASSRGLAWLERHTACRVRFLAEERGLRTAPVGQRPARATIGRLLDARGPERLASIVGELADGAILDSRVLMADRLGRDEGGWPSPEDRYASDLLRSADVKDPWLRALTASAADSRAPIILGGHTLVGPGLPVLLGADRPSPSARR